MNISPDPQLASSTMDYDALLLKETKTHNENVELKSKIEELKEEFEKEVKKGLVESMSVETFKEIKKLREKLEEKEKEVSLINSEEMKNEEEIAKLKEENATLQSGNNQQGKIQRQLEQQVEELQTTIHNIKKIWLDKDDENFDCIDSVVMAMEDNIKDRIIAEEKVEILEKELKEWSGDGVVMNKAGVMLYEDTRKEVKTLQADKVYMEKQFNELKANSIKCFDDLLDNTNREIAGLKKENDEIKKLKKDLKTFKDAVVEALGGPEFNGPYKDCIRLRDITCEIAALKGDGEHHDPETGEIIGLKEFGYLKKENEELKKVVKSNRDLFDASEKEMREIKIAMGCDGPLSWDIKDILKWIDRAKCYTGGPSQADADYEKLVDKNNNDNLNFGDILFEREEEIKRLTKTLQLAEDKIKDLEESEGHWSAGKQSLISEFMDKSESWGPYHDWIKDLKESDDDCRPDAWDAM